MRVFITGASGWIGSAVTDELLAHAHTVLGLARSDAAATALRAKGAIPHPGSLDDLDSLASGAAATDAVIHLAFKHDFTDLPAAWSSEHAAVQAMLTAVEGSGRPFLLASGISPGTDGRPLTEHDAAPFHGADSMRGGGENLALSYADRGVHPVALRFPPTVHGEGDHGFTARLSSLAKEHGTAGYVADGSTRWAAVHRSDAGRVVRLALEKAPAGSRVHAVAEGGVTTRGIAAAIGDSLGLPTASVPAEDAERHFGWLGGLLGADLIASSTITQELLGWTPTGPTLLEDIAAGRYRSA